MLLLDNQGWILSPKETNNSLIKRKNTTTSDPSLIYLPSHPAHNLTEQLYNFRLETIPILISNSSLPPWQGAALWSYTEKDTFPVIQIGTKHPTREIEFLSHELIHAARFSFKEPLFEEILAYQTSPCPLRRFLGPLFLFPCEVWIWLLSFFTCFSLFFFFDSLFFLYTPSILLGLFFFRLCALQAVFYIAKKKLQKMGASHPLALLFRLSDKQIIKIALYRSKEKIKKLLFLDARFKEILSKYF